MDGRGDRTSSRITGVDIARGLALLGILLVNARLFFLPLGFAVDPSIEVPGLEATAADRVAWNVVETLCTFKFISLFSMLFGFGIAVQAARAAAAGRSRWGGGLRRLAVLLPIGLLHGFLVWYGDVLAMYALLGVVVLAASRLSPRKALLAALLAASVGVALIVAGSALRVLAESFPEAATGREVAEVEVVPPEVAEFEVAEFEVAEFEVAEFEAAEAEAIELAKSASDLDEGAAAAPPPRGWRAIVDAGFDPADRVFVEAEIAATREGPFLDALVFRSFSYASGLVISLFSYAWHALAMMLVGVWAHASGLFAAEGSARRRRLARWALPTGLALSLLAVLPKTILADDGTAAATTGIDIAHALFLELGALVLPLGYAAAIVEWGPRLPSILATALARTGRMSLTVYLSESLVATALASWWGLGWFATMGDARLCLLAIGLWAALVVVASWWLGRFTTGPLERLWRRLAGAHR
ncbi:MAG: hypothetical protein RIS86_101 [Planctomycetota bacterium]